MVDCNKKYTSRKRRGRGGKLVNTERKTETSLAAPQRYESENRESARITAAHRSTAKRGHVECQIVRRRGVSVLEYHPYNRNPLTHKIPDFINWLVHTSNLQLKKIKTKRALAV